MTRRDRSKSTEWGELARAWAEGIGAKADAWRRSRQLAKPRRTLKIGRETVKGAAGQLRKLETRGRRGDSSSLHADNAELVRRIREETDRLNRNNVTRTAAYLALYRRYPELHWALLAHLVSRNGGYAMTDLKGEWLPELLTAESIARIFDMLESCNALIFRDAYPQLLLYAESRSGGTSRFALLPAFGVSAFMGPFWERFWIDRDSATLSAALIVNEQNVVERRVVRDPRYRHAVLESAAMLGQRLLQLNQIVFPLELDAGREEEIRPGSGLAESDAMKPGAAEARTAERRTAESGTTAQREKEPATTKPRMSEREEAEAQPKERERPLAGLILESFRDLKERIAFGKKLYAMLFGYPRVLDGALRFALAVPHTGSRADYWPDSFAPGPTAKTGGRPEVSGRSAGSEPEAIWRSPRLEDAWNDRPLGPVPELDWFEPGDASAWQAMRGLHPPRLFDLTREHAFGQRKLQAAVMARALVAGDGESGESG